MHAYMSRAAIYFSNRFSTNLPKVNTVVNTGKHVTFAEITKGVSKRVSARFTLDWYKLYLDSCATYHAVFVRSLLHDVREVKTVLQGNCNAGVSTSNEQGYNGLWNFWLNE